MTIAEYLDKNDQYRLPKDEICLMDMFWEEEQKKPEWLRSAACLLVCNCKKCQGTNKL